MSRARRIFAVFWAACVLCGFASPPQYEITASKPRLAARVSEMLETYPPLPGLPRTAPAFGRSIRIILPDSDREFDSITGGRIPEWGAGVADPERGIIVVPGYAGGRAANSNLQRVLRHELAHVALHRYLEPARVPRWFTEGYATFAAGELDFEGGWQLRVAFATGKAPPLDSLELAWPEGTTDARLAYLLSASVVEYLYRQNGEAGLSYFLERWRTTQDMEQALAAAYRISLDQLEIYWRKDVKKRYGWFAVLTQSAAFMSVATLILVVLFAIRRRRDRARLALLKATEPPDEPAFWNEEPDSIIAKEHDEEE